MCLPLSPLLLLIIFGRPPTSVSTRPPGKRSQSEDSNIVEKPRTSKDKPRSKKGSQHADVIDRLDYTSVGPSMCPISR